MGSDPHETSAVPLTILTGFLGAGKTTLLNRILNGEHGLSVAVLVNDFGAINIDADLVVGVEDDVISLANGCVCCSIRDDLVESVHQVLERPEGVEYVILEASGVADPMSLAATFSNPDLRERIRMDSITCVVDADQVFEDWEYEDFRRLKVLQIGCADLVILNKVDLCGPEQVERIRTWIDEQLNRVRIVEAVHCDVPLEILLSVGRFDATLPVSTGPDHHHEATFDTWSFESPEPVSVDALREMVRRRLPDSVYRCKGVIHAAEAPDRRAILQVVGRRADVTLADGWDGAEPGTRIVAIGAAGRIDKAYLKAQFEGCIAGRQEAVE